MLLTMAVRPLAAQEGAGGTPLPTEPWVAAAAHVEAADARRDAVERALRAARWQERSGQGLVLVGTAGGAGAYAAWVRHGRMGMTAQQATLFMGATGIAMIGARRWVAGRARAARAGAPGTTGR
jgi:hypothetical protein